jgi:hypothetical protein
MCEYSCTYDNGTECHGAYYSSCHPGCCNYYGYYYNSYNSFPASHAPNGSVPGNPYGPENRSPGTAEINVAQPNFANYAYIDMDGILDAKNPVPSTPPVPEPQGVPLNVNNIPGVSSANVSIGGAFFSGLWNTYVPLDEKSSFSDYFVS